jgi:hypothetical protein
MHEDIKFSRVVAERGLCLIGEAEKDTVAIDYVLTHFFFFIIVV